LILKGFQDWDFGVKTLIPEILQLNDWIYEMKTTAAGEIVDSVE
jgi:chlorite dismutase